jgi:MFS transporter, PAT family, beta-lactamase induction signal transducer AmpG
MWMRRSWKDAVAVYLDRRMLAILLMGFASGLPLLLTTSTLSYWLAKRGVDKTAIGLFALVGLPYSLKFLWAPALDFVRVPWLGDRLGRRRAWMLVAQALLVMAIVGLGATDPTTAPFATALLAFAVAFCSATQDVAIDAYRIEVLREEEQGAGAAATQSGYRIGMIVAGAGATALSDFVGWPVVFDALAALVGIGAIAVLLAPEPPADAHGSAAPVATWTEAFLAPMRDLASRPYFPAIVAFALLYKFGDAIAGAMANPFYVELGFSGVEIASVTKVFSIAANLAGVLAGGVLVARSGIWRALLVGGVLQAATNLLFAVQAQVGHSIAMLALAVGADGFTGGLAASAFVAYLSGLCRVGMSASQYALLTSLMAAGRTVLASGSGFVADRTDWVTFFVLTTALATPGLLLLEYLRRRTAATSDEGLGSSLLR